MSTETNNIFDQGFWGEVIHCYTRSQAIEDGVLVDLSSRHSQLCKQLYKYPVACTIAVWSLIEKSVSNPEFGNDEAGVLWDILYMSQKGITRHIDESQHLFEVIITGTGRKVYHSLKIVCGPGDNAEPVLTIMLPEED